MHLLLQYIFILIWKHFKSTIGSANVTPSPLISRTPYKVYFTYSFPANSIPVNETLVTSLWCSRLQHRCSPSKSHLHKGIDTHTQALCQTYLHTQTTQSLNLMSREAEFTAPSLDAQERLICRVHIASIIMLRGV